MADGRLEKELIFYERLEKKLSKQPPIFNEYYLYMRANRKSYTSIQSYINIALHFMRFFCKDEITDGFYKYVQISDIEMYFISLETKETSNGIQRVGDDVLQLRWSALKYFFDFLIKRNYLTTNPVLSVERPKNRTEHTVTYLTEEEIQKLLSVVRARGRETIALRDEAIIVLALATGLRVSAITNLNISDIDFDNNVINVIEKRMKVRQIPIGSNLKKILRRYILRRTLRYAGVNHEALFLSKGLNRLDPEAVNEMLERYCKHAGIKRITAHKLRATAACTLAKNNIPTKAIAKQLGHNDVKTTMRYIDVFNEDIEKTVNTLDNLF